VQAVQVALAVAVAALYTNPDSQYSGTSESSGMILEILAAVVPVQVNFAPTYMLFMATHTSQVPVTACEDNWFHPPSSVDLNLVAIEQLAQPVVEVN